MKKSLITSAVAAGLLTAGAASADPIVYGILHLSIDTYADDHLASPGGPGAAVLKSSDLNMTSHTSAIGIKGAEDLGDGLKAIYKVEFQINPDERCNSTDVTANDSTTSPDGIVNYNELGSSGCDAITDRDQWIGLQSSAWGSVKLGTMSSNYKQMGGKVDPLYRTEAEGRGILNLQSGLHSGAGIDRGRMTNAVQYASPEMGGVQLVANTTFSGAGANNSNNDETIGVGIRYNTKEILAYFDYIEPGNQGANSESAMKIGGKYSTDMFSLSLQYEMTEDLFCAGIPSCSGGDYIFAAGTYSIDKNNVVALSLGQQDKVSQGYAIAYVHNLSKKTNVYAGYGSVEEDSTGSYSAVGFDENGNPHTDGSVFTFGMRKKF